MELFKLFGTIAIGGADTAKEQIDDVSEQAGKLAAKIDAFGTKISDFGGALTAKLSIPLTALGTIAVKSAADVKAANSQYEQTFGELQDTATKAINKIADASGILDTRLKGVGTSIYAFAKASGADSAEAMSLMEEALQATADAAAYYDRSLDDTAESLQSFLKGNYENDAALGVSCTETTRNAKAMELFGQKFNDLTEIQKQQTLLKMVTDAQKLSGAMGQASRESDGFENVMGNLKESGRLLAAEFGELLLPTVIELMQELTGFIQKLNGMDEGTKKLILTIAGIAVAVGPVLIVIGKVTSGIGEIIRIGGILKGNIGNFTSVLTSLTGAGSKLLTGIVSTGGKITGTLIPAITSINPAVLGIIAVIGALVAAGVALYKNWDEVSAWAESAWSSIKETVGNAIGAIAGFFTQIIDFVKNNWQGLLLMLANPFVGAFKLIYDNSEAFRNFIDNFLDGLKEGFTNFANNIVERATNLKEKAVAKFNELKDGGVEKFNELKENATAQAEELKEKAVSKFNELKDKAKAKVEELKGSAVEKFNELKEKATAKVEELKEKAVSKFNELKDKTTEKITTLKNKGVELVEGLKTKAIESFENLKSGALERFESLKSGISEKLEGVKSFVGDTVQRLKDFFNFDWSLPKIKLPHFSLDGEFSLMPPSIPKIGVEWYSKAMDNPMIMDSPTIFGYNAASGQFLGGGEAGSEVVSGTNTLMNMIQNAVSNQNGELVAILWKILEAIIAMDENMGGNLREALAGTAFEVNKREFARLVKAVK